MPTLSSNLKHLRLLLGRSQGEFAEQLGIAQSTLSSVERENRPPSTKLINTARFQTGVSAEYFEASIHFYAAPDLLFHSAREGRANADKIAAAFSITEHYLRERYPDVTSDLPTIPIADLEGELSLRMLEEFASQTRDHFGIDQDSMIPNLTTVLNNHGILVTSLPDYVVEGTNFDGVSTPTDSTLRIIALNQQRSGDRYRFSLAHELAHLILHANTLRSDKSQMEKEANIFAASFLMPRALLTPVITPELTLKDYAELKAQWGYSIQAIVRRAHELELIDYKRYRSLRMQIAGRGWNINEPVDVLLENVYIDPIDLLSNNIKKHQSTNEGLATVTSLHKQ